MKRVLQEIYEGFGETQESSASADYPQANGLVERQNRTMKDKLPKILENDNSWISCINEELFLTEQLCLQINRLISIFLVS